MRRSSRVTAGFAALAVVGALAVALDAGSFLVAGKPASARAGGSCAEPGQTSDPYTVAQKFLITAVERKDLPHAYRLATPSLRRGVSCAQWVHGRVPVTEVANIDWSRSGYKLVGAADGRLVLRILLFQPNAPLPAPFVMELRRGGAGWQVGSFRRDSATAAQTPALAA